MPDNETPLPPPAASEQDAPEYPGKDTQTPAAPVRKRRRKPAMAQIADPRKKVLTRLEIHAEYGLPPKTLQKLEYERHLIKSIKIVRTRCYFRSDIEKVLIESR